MPARRLAILNTKFGYAPKTGSKILRLSLDFTESLTIDISLLQDLIDNAFGTPQAIYIDNSDNAGVLSITPAGADMKVKCPSNSIGMFPFAVSEKMAARFVHTVANAHVDAWLLNVPQPYFVYPVL